MGVPSRFERRWLVSILAPPRDVNLRKGFVPGGNVEEP